MKFTTRAFVRMLPCLATLLAVASRADAKAAFAGKDEMIKRSVAIAVVEITRVENVEVKGAQWTYGQRATARVEKVLKGDLPKEGTINLHGDENFICARCHFEPGRYVVFLQQDAGLWVGCNWHLSVRPIGTHAEKGELVEWFANDKDIDVSSLPLADVLADVAKRVGAGK